MFDVNQKITVSVRCTEGVKQVTARYPIDEELIQAYRSRKIVTTSVGKGLTKTDVEGADEANLQLFNQIRESGDDLLAEEASHVVEQILQSKVVDVQETGGTAIITLKTAAGETKHTLRYPTVAEVRRYRRVAYELLSGRFGKQMLRVNLQADITLYDAICVSTDGYTSAVPANHKSAVLAEFLSIAEGDEAPE